MIYGSAEFMGIPWESIIKIYRGKLGKQRFDKLTDYGDNFIDFLKSTPLFPKKEQEKYLVTIIQSYFNLIRSQLDKTIKEKFNTEEEINENNVKKIVSKVINEHFLKLKKRKNLPKILLNQAEKLVIKYKKNILKIKEEIFQKLPIENETLFKLKKIVGYLFTKDIFPEPISGVVIAGFGECDTFPSIQSFAIEAKIDNKLKYQEKNWEPISFSNSAGIIPFAQSEMVATFMEGIDPNISTIYERYLQKLLSEYPDYVIENIKKISVKEKNEVKNKLILIGERVLKDLKTKIKGIINIHVQPIISAVSILPKDELAAMAEALVNLTSFKRKVSMGPETVGGPIDVAVISKGDGFVWIKRKHYFKSELNPNFFLNYFSDYKSEGKK